MVLSEGGGIDVGYLSFIGVKPLRGTS